MKLLIEIPKEFENHYKIDKFKDSFGRIAFDTKHTPVLAGNYEYELLDMLEKAFEKSEIIHTESSTYKG